MGTENIDALIRRAKILATTDPESALKMLEDAAASAKRLDYRRGLALAVRERAAVHLNLQHFKRALTGFTEALEFFRQLDDKAAMVACRNQISGIYFKLGDCAPALEHVLANLQSHTLDGDSHGVAECYNDIGDIYAYLQAYDKAVEHYKKALKIFEGLRNKRESINSFYLLSNVFRSAGDDDRCMYYLLRAVNSIEDVPEADLKTRILIAMADLYTRKKEYEKALSTFKEAIAAAASGVSPATRIQLDKNQGRLHLELTQYDKSIEVLSTALEQSKLLPPDPDTVTVHRLLAMAYEQMGDNRSALAFYKRYHELDRQVLSESVNLKTKALHFRYDLEELRKQKEIAELSDRLKEQFLANVSHEIRTPMNGVLGMTHLLDKTPLNEEQKEYIQAIQDSANNLMVIINDILDFSKINAGKIEFSNEEFRLRDLVKGIIQILKVKADEKQLRLSVNIDYRIGDRLKGDAIRLNQILTNLLGNAIKFTDKGEVHLEIKQIDGENGASRLKFTVADTGHGIPELKLDRIFESFEQAEDDSRRRSEGTGLGLAIVKQLVELQGGNINVKSKPGTGSEFVFELGFDAVSEPIPASDKKTLPTQQQDRLASMRILVVEDNKVNQLLVKNMLRQYGCTQVETVDGGRSAIRRLEAAEFDLVLMDIQMPEMDGYEATLHIRTRLPEAKRKIPVIALTADASEKEKEKAKRSGMDDYVVKPYTPEELVAAISRQISEQPEPSVDVTRRLQKERKEVMIRMDVLEKYTGGDSEMTIQLMEVFLRQVPEACSQLQRGVMENDWSAVFGTAHKIKSSLSVFGLNDLRRIAQRMEDNAREQEKLEELPGLLNSFLAKATPAIDSLESELARLRATTGPQAG